MAQSFVTGLRPRGRAQSARVPESDGATARAVCRTLGIRPHRCFACMLAWAVDRTDFRASRSGGGSEAAAAHSLRECRRARVPRRGPFAGPWVSGHTDDCTHVGAVGRWDRFSTIEKRRRECAGCRAQSARVPESDGAAARAVCRTLGIRSHRCLHACWRGRSIGPIFEHREAAVGVSRLPLTVCESAGERGCRGAGRLPDLRYPVTPMLAHMLVWVVDGTDFRPSRNSSGSEVAAAHSRRECGRAMARRRGQFAGPSVSGHKDALRAHVGVGGRWDRFPSIDKRRRECSGRRAQPA